MNSLKPVIIVAVLAAVAFGVYVSINRNLDTARPRGEAPPWSGAPKAQIPGPDAAQPQFPSGPTAVPGTGLPGMGPSATGVEATPPQFTLPANPPAPVGTLDGTAAPAYSSPRYPGTLGVPVSPGSSLGAGDLRSAPDGRGGVGLPPATLRDGASAPANPASAPSTRNGAGRRFASVMQAVDAQLQEGRLAEAHLLLSSLYNDPDVPIEQVGRVTELLDQLAGTVIYSTEHLLEPAYTVRPGDKLEQIAQNYDVPWQLLGKINGIRDPQRLEPGRQLKLVRGPFKALIDLTKYELTLMLGSRYAGRFPIGVGRDQPNPEGTYVVRDKTVNPQYYGSDRTIDADDPSNPLGEFWIGLDNQIGIHGSNDPANLHRTGGRGCICLGDQDIEDVFGILSIGSRVVIRR
jgi:LysM repeat protein